MLAYSKTHQQQQKTDGRRHRRRTSTQLQQQQNKINHYIVITTRRPEERCSSGFPRVGPLLRPPPVPALLRRPGCSTRRVVCEPAGPVAAGRRVAGESVVDRVLPRFFHRGRVEVSAGTRGLAQQQQR
ncbi:unnamed protein product [Laminaria digitata]